jgi:dipeptidyl aminopeptidase/acylaminoacyl peptidase
MDTFDRLVVSLIAVLLLAIGLVIAAGDHAGIPIREVYPENGSTPPATSEIAITFTQAMDTGSVEDRFNIEPAVQGTFTWDGATLKFRPVGGLISGQQYSVELEQGLQTSNGRETREPYRWSFTPRQSQILYLGPFDNPVRALKRISSDSGESVEMFAPVDGILDFSVSPDGQQIALSVYKAVDELAVTNLWLMNTDGSDSRLVIDCAPGSCANPAWSPDGKVIAFERQEASSTGSIGPSRVWLYNPVTRESTPVFEDNQVLGFGPVWSPDGSRLAFFDGNVQAIKVMTLSSGSVIEIPNMMGDAGTFAPDGNQLAYVDVRQVGVQFYAQLWLADLSADVGLRELLEASEEDQSPAWSPDGKWIAFARRRLDRSEGWGSQLALVDVASGKIRILTDDLRFNNTHFDWSPNGNQILIQRFNLETNSSSPELWIYDLTDNTMTHLVDNAYNAAWLP